MTFLLSEDEALKNLLKGIVVTDQKAAGTQQTTRNVDVRFGQPDQEISDQKYPYIIIDMIDIAEDTTRAMRGMVKPVYLDNPAEMPPVSEGDDPTAYDSETNNWRMHWPIPVNIDYQVTTYSRQPRHDREILGQILTQKIPMRFAILEPDDGNSEGIGTVRRLDLLDIAKRDVTEQGKRLFVNAFTVRVSSEITESTYIQVYKALQTNVTGATDDQGNTDGSPITGRGQFTAIEPFTISQP
jgi:hypothetical protein